MSAINLIFVKISSLFKFIDLCTVYILNQMYIIDIHFKSIQMYADTTSTFQDYNIKNEYFY